MIVPYNRLLPDPREIQLLRFMVHELRRTVDYEDGGLIVSQFREWVAEAEVALAAYELGRIEAPDPRE